MMIVLLSGCGGNSEKGKDNSNDLTAVTTSVQSGAETNSESNTVPTLGNTPHGENSYTQTSSMVDTDNDKTSATNSNDTVSKGNGGYTEKPSKPTVKPTCSHGNYFKDKGYGIPPMPGNWFDMKPGVENRAVVDLGCTEKRIVVYKCPQCLEPVFYEELEPIGHNFSGEEVLLFYPSVNKAGSYGKKCQGVGCYETKLTTAIPKRAGDYSTIDSCFTVSISESNNQECYKMEELEIIIRDYRTWGSVPTITYDKQANLVTIKFLRQDGTTAIHTIMIDSNHMDHINQGWWYSGDILENGQYDGYYLRLAT